MRWKRRNNLCLPLSSRRWLEQRRDFFLRGLLLKHAKNTFNPRQLTRWGMGADYTGVIIDWRSNQSSPIKENAMNTTLNQNRSLNLFIVVGLAVALIAAIVLASPASIDVPAVPQNAAEDQRQIALAPLAADAFPAYRESEWHASAAAVTGVDGMDIYRLSERTLVDPFAEYHASERGLVGIPVTGVTDAEAYYSSERTLIPVMVDFSGYLESERTLVDVPDGMTIYRTSEWTVIPVRFTPYQLSEWFGK